MPDVPPPVFTIGNRESYVAAMMDARSKGQVLLKLGQSADKAHTKSQYYSGGIIFQNPRDARKYINEEWPKETRPAMEVFEVKASWEHDCYSLGDDMYWRYLVYSRPITMMVVMEKGGD